MGGTPKNHPFIHGNRSYGIDSMLYYYRSSKMCPFIDGIFPWEVLPRSSDRRPSRPYRHTGGLALGVRRLATQGATDATCEACERKGLEVLGDSMVTLW